MTHNTVRNIDVALLQAFVAVADTGSMTLAARMLHRTQGAVSQQIGRLEALFDEPLFDRRPSALHLTTAGERLLVGAHRMIAENDGLFATMRGKETLGEIRLGIPPDVMGALVPGALRAFRTASPGVRVTLVSQGTRALHEQAAQGRIDLAVTTDAQPSAAAEPLMSDKLVWVGAPGGTAHLGRPMPVALGEESCAFRAACVSALVHAGIDWHPVVQVGSLEPVIATLAADAAIAVFLSRTVPAGLVIMTGPSLPDLPKAYVNLVRGSGATTPAIEEMAEILRERAAELAI